MNFKHSIILYLVLVNIAFSQKQYSEQSIEEILKLPEDEISMSIATLVLAKEFYPELNVPVFLQTFNYMADRFNYYYENYTEPEDRIRSLNTYLYKPGYWNDSITFTYDDDDLHVTKLKNKFINGYLSTKKGSCITMPMLYVILGEKLNIPIKPVRSAKHFFIRYEPKRIIINFQNNIEATNGGGYISNIQYQEDLLIPDKAISNGVYLRSLSKKEYIASLLLINANEYLQQRKIKKAKRYYKLALKYDPTFSSAYMNYGMTVFGEARQLEEKMWEEKKEVINNLSTVYLPKSKQEEPQQVNNKNYILESESQKMLKELLFEPKAQHNENTEQTLASLDQQREIELQLKLIEGKYKPTIVAKIAEYKEFTGKAKELGIVLEFPLRFFQKQAESIKRYRENGGH